MSIPKSAADLQQIAHEQQLNRKWRDAIQHCKDKLDFSHVKQDYELDEDQRMQFEKCLTQDYLLKHGLNYFGERDFLYIDMIGSKDLKRHAFE